MFDVIINNLFPACNNFNKLINIIKLIFLLNTKKEEQKCTC